MSLPKDEQETSIAWMRDDAYVEIFTSNRMHLDRFRKLVSTADYVTEVSGTDEYATFRVEVEFFHLFSAVRAKRQVSAATRAKLAASLAAAREARS